MLARGEARSREVIAAQCDLWKAEKQGFGILGSATQTSCMQVCLPSAFLHRLSRAWHTSIAMHCCYIQI